MNEVRSTISSRARRASYARPSVRVTAGSVRGSRPREPFDADLLLVGERPRSLVLCDRVLELRILVGPWRADLDAEAQPYESPRTAM